MGGTDVQSAAPVRVGPRAGVRGQPKSPGKAPPGAETSPGRLARASAKLEWKHARPANASPRHRPAPRKIPPLPEVRLLHSFRSPIPAWRRFRAIQPWSLVVDRRCEASSGDRIFAPATGDKLAVAQRHPRIRCLADAFLVVGCRRARQGFALASGFSGYLIATASSR